MKILLKLFPAISIFLIIVLPAYATDSESRYATTSQLTDGKWVRIQLKETGIYQISYAELKQLGFPDPAKVSVYGYGGWPLEEDFSKQYIDDLPQMSVYRGDDFLLFYGKGVVKWGYGVDSYNDKINRFVHTNNPYSEYGYYFLSDRNPVKESELIESKIEASLRITKFDDYCVHEIDRVSLNQSGRELYGEYFHTPKVSFVMDGVEGITDDNGLIEMRLVAHCTVAANKQVALSINELPVLNAAIPVDTSKNIYLKALPLTKIVEWEGEKKTPFNVNITISDTKNNAVYLDYVRMSFKRELRVYDEPFTFFRSIESNGRASRFIINNANTHTRVFDVTDGINMRLVETKLNGTELSFTIPESSVIREFVIVQLDKKFPTIDFKAAKNISNQNLHGLEQTDMVIISPPAFRNEAKRLAEAHLEKDGINSHIITPEEIYNEFSSGTPDATAYRRFMKMFYDRSKDIGMPPRYLLLFGDGAFDNRFITSDWSSMRYLKDDLLLTYQTQESLNDTSQVVDDYFGFLDDEEGRNINNDVLDIGIGRFPVRTYQEAQQMVDKVLRFMNTQNVGMWKNRVCMVADNGSTSDKFLTTHQTNAEGLSNIIEAKRPEYMISKLYFDMFSKTEIGGITTIPAVKEGIQKNLNDGLFLINYVGHGNTTAWGDEKVLNQNDINQSRYEALPIWITATCDFCPFDSPVTSAGESVFLSTKGGGIALITTSRVAVSSSNDKINTEVFNVLFDENRSNELRLGDVIKTAKMNYRGNGVRKLGFCLIGDPALKLYYPSRNIKINRINGHDVDERFFTFKAMEKVTFEGIVLDDNGATDAGFNGDASVTMFDNQDTYTTMTQHVKYKDYKNKLYSGVHAVKDGAFKFTVTIPKDIAYSSINKGKISMYAYDNISKVEAQGYFNGFQVGGTSEDIEKDITPPEILALHLNDSLFVDSGKVNNTPLFYAKVWDESGINTTGNGIGHDIVLIIDNKTYILNNYYAPLNESGEGVVAFSIPKLEAGMHTGMFVVWDVLNNSSKQEFCFEVVEDMQPNLYRISATPNPAKELVEFRLSHDRPETIVEVEIMVYDPAGRLVWKHKETGHSSAFKDYIVSWDLTTNSGANLRPSVYFYRAAIRSKGTSESTRSEKLIILRRD